MSYGLPGPQGVETTVIQSIGLSSPVETN